MTADRRLEWDGCANVRDLGGLPTAGGRLTRVGAVVRGDCPDRLTPAGWSALHAHGIRTIVDLRNPDERAAGGTPPPEGIATVHIPLDGIEHADFWDEWTSGIQFSTPLYYGPFLERFPDRTAAAIAAIAHAPPGGVFVHCVMGRDRAGLVALLLLALAGVAPEDIAADHTLSAECLGGEPEIEDFLASRGTTAAAVVLSTLESLDVDAHLRAGGLGDADLAAARARLL